MRSIRRGVYLIKPSVRELGDYVGHPLIDRTEQLSQARRLVSDGMTEIVLLSLGAAGALMVTRDRHEWFAAIPARVRSGIGAGDAMVGGTTVGLTRDTNSPTRCVWVSPPRRQRWPRRVPAPGAAGTSRSCTENLCSTTALVGRPMTSRGRRPRRCGSRPTRSEPQYVDRTEVDRCQRGRHPTGLRESVGRSTSAFESMSSSNALREAAR